ncbi:hypothetical protein [Synechococcus phage DSL-LC02]|nr:hypothetical protein [Synechococcus phage DSL-LC02]
MDDIDFNTFISVYQKKLNESITQSIALEARVISLSQKVSSLTQEIESLKAVKQRKKPEDFS